MGVAEIMKLVINLCDTNKSGQGNTNKSGTVKSNFDTTVNIDDLSLNELYGLIY